MSSEDDDDFSAGEEEEEKVQIEFILVNNFFYIYGIYV